MATPNPFKKATKAQLKARVAFDGPSGAGKSWTSLEWATVLAQGGQIAVIDTEHGSASLYADHFDFDVLVWDPPYDPGKLADTIRQAQGGGYATLVIDSLSHFWEGEGGTRDIVDAASERAKGNTFAGWKVGTPALRHLIDVMLGCDMHVIATMRSKMEYVLETDSRGKQVPTKVGMAPVMRAGVEYEFTLIGDMDLEHRVMFSKSRCPALADTMAQPGRAGDSAEAFLGWLNTGTPMAAAATVAEIKARLNALDGEARKHFRAHIGHPDRLRADQVPDALTMLTDFEAGAAETPKTSTPEGSGHRVAADPPAPVHALDDGQRDPPPVEPSSDGDTTGDTPAYTFDDLDQFLTASGITGGQAMLKARRIAGTLDVEVPQSLDTIKPGVLLDALMASLKGAAPMASDFVPMDQVQNRRVHALINKARPGQDRHQVMSELLGRPVTSAKELSTDDAQRIADALNKETKAAS